MPIRNKLAAAPPYAIEQSLKQLGANLRTARLRRNLSREEIAGKIGAGLRAVADAERGKPSTGIVVYAALLWALDLLDQMDGLAQPETDKVGQQLALARERARAKPKAKLDNDF